MKIEGARFFVGALSTAPVHRPPKGAGFRRKALKQTFSMFRRVLHRWLGTVALLIGSRAQMTTPPPATLGTYDLQEVLGRGAMGVVYRARDRSLGRLVALKLLPEEMARDPERLARFEREAQLLARLQHPNIAIVHGFEPSGPQPYIAMEFVDGQDLAQVLSGGALPTPMALSILSQLASALCAAHHADVVHRDLKPANILLTSNGRIKLVDFGIACAAVATPLGDDPTMIGEPMARLTTAGTLIGTAPYMSPEQVQGQTVDSRADVWAFGCVAFEILVGHSPFLRPTAVETIAAILRDEPDWNLLPEDVPLELVDLLRRCLDKSIDQRPRQVGGGTLETTAAPYSTDLRVGNTKADSLDARLARAREAYSRRRWHEAWDELDAADHDDFLAAEDLERLGWLARWTGRYGDVIGFLERAEKAFVAEGDDAAAARVACFQAFYHGERLKPSLKMGCAIRAQRLLKNQPVGREHARLAWFKSVESNLLGDLDAARTAAQTSLEIARSCGDEDLVALARTQIGHAHLASGEIEQGRQLLNEAVATALSGGLEPFATGFVYCTVITAYCQMTDWERAGEITHHANAWCDSSSIGYFPGLCRVHRAEVLRLSGSFDEAEKDAQEGLAILTEASPLFAAHAHLELANLALKRGRLAEADEECQKVTQAGRDPQPVLAQLHLARGEAQMALRGLERFIEDRKGSLEREARVRILPVAITASIASHEPDKAARFLQELEELVSDLATAAPRAALEQARGESALGQGDAAAAGHLRTARRLWCEIGAPYEAATCQTLLAEAYEREGDQACARTEYRAALAAFDELGCERDSARVDEALTALG
jgi:hypothetical protein